jgi:hypothetical protein
VRKHLYIVIDTPHEDLIGCVRAVDTRFEHGKKNEERTIRKRNMETNETFTESLVGLGYYDFKDQDDYEERFVEVSQEKLLEVDEEHLEKVDINPENLKQ